MEYVIQLLENEKKILERAVRDPELMYKNRKQATQHLKSITEIKKAIKVLKSKARQTGSVIEE